MNGPLVRSVNVNDPVRPVPQEGAITLTAAKNEWASFTVQLDRLPRANSKRPHSLRMRPLRLNETNEAIPVEQYSAFQVIELPVDVNRAGYVRHTGLSVENRDLPRALLPVRHEKGLIDLRALRNPRDASNPDSRATEAPGEPVLVWVDIHVPPETKPGEYIAQVELLEQRGDKPLALVEVRLIVHDFVLPDERHLQMISRVEWEDLQRLFPPEFEAVRPQFVTRNDPQYASTVRVLDQLVSLAQRNRTQVVIPRLQPIVKWTGVAPSVTWDELDTVIAPWLNGDVFVDRTSLGYWPLPAPDFLSNYDLKSRLAYWSSAASHFAQNQWLSRAPIFIEKASAGRAGPLESIQLSAEAAQLLNLDDRLRVMVPLEKDQLAFAGEGTPSLIDPRSSPRVLASAPGLVFNTPVQAWSEGIAQPAQWLRTDLWGLVPYIGAGGDERDVRLWSWLAFLRDASMILWGSALPRTDNPQQPAEPGNLVWFYPGHWFGLGEPVPSIQLKWLRRAQQDYEYLWLSKQRGEWINALLMARLVTKQVEIQPNQSPDPTYALMSGMTNPAAWAEAQRLLAQSVLLREPGQPVDEQQRRTLNLAMLHWAQSQERPVLMGRSVQWFFDSPDSGQPGEWLSLRMGIDIYNGSDKTLDQNTLAWTMPAPFEVTPQPTAIAALAAYRVQKLTMDARFNMNQAAPTARKPVELTFIDGFYKQATKLQVVLPVAPSERRRPGLDINGNLDDWETADALQTGPLVQMYNRPALQRGQLQEASTPSTIYSAWADENFYLAFQLGGTPSADIKSARNFVNYQFRRAWDEDLAQVLVQPIYNDNSVGPVLHLVLKPTGGHWVERKTDARRSVDPWQPVEGAGIYYACTLDGDWRGELRIPWKVITDANKGRPRLLRFNFSQHKHTTGESASWAGPIDFGRDDGFMGLIYLRETDEPGMPRQ
ncbi:MAG TPA: hypothetical protein VGR35_15340 [Tepidisphaeraceae bacterium]|nr:hypothetical protein [Tepidisphaeraceae bacterium]